MELGQAHGLRGLGTLARVVGPTTVTHVSRCLARVAEEDIAGEEDVIRCPVCRKSFGDVVSESQMTRHVDACLCQPDDGVVAEGYARADPAGAPEDIDLVDLLDGNDSGDDGQAMPSIHSPRTFSTIIVGRRHGNVASETLRHGLDVRIALEMNNPHDVNALLCTIPSGAVIGHLPAVVAAELGPLLRTGIIKHVGGVVVRDAGRFENVMVSVAVSTGGDHDAGFVESIVQSLRSIAIDHMKSLVEAPRRFLYRLNHIFETVEEIEQRALGDAEGNLLKAWKQLPSPARLLFARLAMRNKTHFASNKVVANNVSDVQGAVLQLIAAGVCRPLDVSDLKSCPASRATDVINDVYLNKTELIEALVEVGRPPESNARRDELVTALVTYLRTPSQLKWSFVVAPSKTTPFTARDPAKIVANACGTVFNIDAHHLLAFHRVLRLYFLNEGQSLHQLHAVDAGAMRYPPFPITREREVFRDRIQFVEYEQALAHGHQLIDAIERSGKSATVSPNEAIDAALSHVWDFLDSERMKIAPDETTPPFLAQYNAGWLYAVMATVGIGILEKKKAYRTAVDRIQQLLGGFHCPERRGYWWVRLSINLEHLGRPKDSLELAETALADPSIAAHERLTLRKRVLKLSKPPRRWIKPAWVKEMPPEPRRVTIAAKPLARGSSGPRVRYESADSVEELALQHYASDEGGNFDGIHSESSVFTTIFTLILWPALFDIPVPDVFRTALQTAPLDLGHPGFYERRSSQIEEILSAVEGGHAPRLMQHTWDAYHGTLARGIGSTWNNWDISTLQCITECIGGRGLAAICRILARDYATMSSGMPDLLLWNAEIGVAKLSEVKSANDVLSDKQRVWINELERAGVDVEVIDVKHVRDSRDGSRGRDGAGKRPRTVVPAARRIRSDRIIDFIL